MTLTMYTGDLEPDLEVTLSSSAGAVDVTTAVSVRVIGRRGGTIIFDRNPNDDDVTVAVAGDNSVVTMSWEAGDTDAIGRIQVEVEVTWPGTRPQTFRAEGGVDVHADFDLN